MVLGITFLFLKIQQLCTLYHNGFLLVWGSFETFEINKAIFILHKSSESFQLIANIDSFLLWPISCNRFKDNLNLVVILTFTFSRLPEYCSVLFELRLIFLLKTCVSYMCLPFWKTTQYSGHL